MRRLSGCVGGAPLLLLQGAQIGAMESASVTFGHRISDGGIGLTKGNLCAVCRARPLPTQPMPIIELD